MDPIHGGGTKKPYGASTAYSNVEDRIMTGTFTRRNKEKLTSERTRLTRSNKRIVGADGKLRKIDFLLKALEGQNLTETPASAASSFEEGVGSAESAKSTAPEPKRIILDIKKQVPCQGIIFKQAKVSPFVPEADVIDPILDEKRARLDELKEEEEKLSKEIAEFESSKLSDLIKEKGLKVDAKLIDLLNLIVDPSDDWIERLKFLINIPNKEPGAILKGGDYFEALFHLLFAMNQYPLFKEERLTFWQIQKGGKALLPFRPSDAAKDGEQFDYLYEQDIISSGGGKGVQGVSDITFRLGNPSEKPEIKYECGEPPFRTYDSGAYYFFSVKGYLREKAAKNYDISALFHQLDEFDFLERSQKKICLGVRNKADFCAKLNRSHMEFLKESLSIVIGFDELISYFDDFRKDFFLKFGKSTDASVRMKNLQLRFPKNEPRKDSLKQYFHQELITEAVINRIKSKKEMKTPYYLCIGVLPRGGKSYIAGGIINEHRKLLKKPKYNVLFMTSAVTETKSQFEKDLILKFAEFHDFQFVDPRVDTRVGDNNFVFISRQLSARTRLQAKASEEEEEEAKEKEDSEFVTKQVFEILEEKGINLEFDIVFFDEAHIGTLTEKQQQNFKLAFEKFKLPIVMLTATYMKPSSLLSDGIKDLFVWDLFDIKDMRKIADIGEEALEKIDKRFQKLAKPLFKRRLESNETVQDIIKPYQKFPMPVFITPTFSPETLHKLNEFEHKDFFEMNLTKENEAKLRDARKWKEWHLLLKNREHALRLRSYLTPSDNDSETKIDENHKAFIQIFRKSQKEGVRPVSGVPFSVLMFLPSIGNSNNVSKICRVWASFLMQTPFWNQNFVALTLSEMSDEKTRQTVVSCVDEGICIREMLAVKDLKEKIIEIEQAAAKKNKGLVILTGEVAKMGISLPCTDVVLMMDDGRTADDIIQKMFRGLTESTGKKYGYIVDLNLNRIVAAMMDYKKRKDRLVSKKFVPSEEEQKMEVFELCDWGYDQFIEDNSDELSFERIMENIKTMVFENLEKKDIVDVRKIYEDKIFTDLDAGEMSELAKLIDTTRKPPPPPGVKESKTRKGKKRKGEAKGRGKPAAGDEPSGEPNFEYNFKALVTTFINSLILRNHKLKWEKSIRVKSLLKELKKAKDAAVMPINCKCDDGGTCSYKANLYERVYCDIKSYSKEKENVELLLDTLTELIKKKLKTGVDLGNFIEDYIDTLIQKIKGSASGGRRVTRKNR